MTGQVAWSVQPDGQSPLVRHRLDLAILAPKRRFGWAWGAAENWCFKFNLRVRHARADSARRGALTMCTWAPSVTGDSPGLD